QLRVGFYPLTHTFKPNYEKRFLEV
ncbi:hypothetical protein MGSAQ_000164, partial [marine sediment metagenome]